MDEQRSGQAERSADIVRNVQAFYQRIIDDPNHRFRSWEHCYRHFMRTWRSAGEVDLDTAALHLAFYLASWGMYRGSSFLLWKDFRVHKAAVREMLQPKYATLRGLTATSLGGREQADLVFELMDKLRVVYGRIRTQVVGHQRPLNQVSDILITKAILGGLACIPAYDRLFKQGVRETNLLAIRLGRNSYDGLVKFVRANVEAFQTAQGFISEHAGFEYPAMKIVDMYFWSIGYKILGDVEEGDEE